MIRAHRARQERAPFPTCGPQRGRRGTQGYRAAPPALPLLITAVLALLLVTVGGRSRRGRDVFDRRRTAWGRGIFLTPSMIDSLALEHPAEVLKGIEKIDVRWTWGEN